MYPNTDDAYDKTAMYDVFDSTTLVDTYYAMRNYIVHTLPLVATVYMTFYTKAIYL